jgi:thiamine-monophosphate kinase
MIDISDGLSSEILHICRNSEAGCRLYHEKIPIHPQTIQTAEELNIEPLICALHGGEDYELLFTVPLSEFDKLSAIDGISIIGSITVKEDGTNLVTKDGNEMALTAQGWDGLEFEPRRRA